jgi:hypothetical protein
MDRDREASASRPLTGDPSKSPNQPQRLLQVGATFGGQWVWRALNTREREDDMAILKAPPKPQKNETLQLRVEEGVGIRLQKYAEFIGSSESYVVSEALKLLFRKDDEFKNWLEQHAANGDQQENGHSNLFETTKKA